jgi:hypothetical protein
VHHSSSAGMRIHNLKSCDHIRHKDTWAQALPSPVRSHRDRNTNFFDGKALSSSVVGVRGTEHQSCSGDGVPSSTLLHKIQSPWTEWLSECWDPRTLSVRICDRESVKALCRKTVPGNVVMTHVRYVRKPSNEHSGRSPSSLSANHQATGTAPNY